jgi:hypothetical protein
MTRRDKWVIDLNHHVTARARGRGSAEWLVQHPSEMVADRWPGGVEVVFEWGEHCALPVLGGSCEIQHKVSVCMLVEFSSPLLDH